MQISLWALFLSLLACNIHATAQRSYLECENLYCRASGTVGLDNLTYPYSVPSNADFDLVVTLISRQGDVDL